MPQKNLLLILILVIITGAGGFFAGIKYQQSQRPNFNRQFPTGQNTNGQQMRLRAGGRQVMGEVISQDDLSITVKMPDASSRIVLLSDSTAINQATAATKADLKIGQQVAVFGTDNADGSVTAQNIQLNPIRPR